MSVLSSEEFTAPIVKVDCELGVKVFRSGQQVVLKARGGGGMLVHCLVPDNFILFNFWKNKLYRFSTR